MVLFFLWCFAPLALASTTSHPTSCGCSGSQRIEIHHDKYLSQDCSDITDSQSRTTIDAKGIRRTTSYNHSDVDWTNIRGDVLVSGKLAQQKGIICVHVIFSHCHLHLVCPWCLVVKQVSYVLFLQGNFQYLGAVRFPAGFNAHQSVVSMHLLLPHKVPDNLRMLLFSDQPASFAMVLTYCMLVLMHLATSIVCVCVVVLFSDRSYLSK